jgi:hypothetical protein
MFPLYAFVFNVVPERVLTNFQIVFYNTAYMEVIEILCFPGPLGRKFQGRKPQKYENSYRY